jgi:hypothetical protein
MKNKLKQILIHKTNFSLGDVDEGTPALSSPSLLTPLPNSPWLKPHIPTTCDFIICYSTLQGLKKLLYFIINGFLFQLCYENFYLHY